MANDDEDQSVTRRESLLSLWGGIAIACYGIGIATYFGSYADKMPKSQMVLAAVVMMIVGVMANLFGVIRINNASPKGDRLNLRAVAAVVLLLVMVLITGVIVVTSGVRL